MEGFRKEPGSSTGRRIAAGLLLASSLSLAGCLSGAGRPAADAASAAETGDEAKPAGKSWLQPVSWFKKDQAAEPAAETAEAGQGPSKTWLEQYREYAERKKKEREEAAAADAKALEEAKAAHAGKSWLPWLKKPAAAEAEATAEAMPAASGSSWLPSWLQRQKPAGAADSLVVKGDQVEDAATSPELAAAHELYRQEQYKAARKAFNKVAEDTKTLPRVAEEARFHEAECYRRQEYYRDAVDTYYRMLKDFPNGPHRQEACQRMFDIANYWLQDTRTEMEANKEKEEGKRWFVIQPVVHFERSKPWIDVEGHALQALERVYLHDIRGPLADRSLFLIGTVKFYREDYAGADHYFSQMVELYPNSKLASRAVELGIISKQLSTGGADYDGRKVQQARRLINTAFAGYPDLAQERKDFLMKQLASCNLQQAEKDFKIAEFYRRTSQPGSAYFYYEIVRRRYPGTEFFDQATERMHELRAAAEKQNEKKVAAPPPPKQELPPADGDTLPPPRPLPGGLAPGTPLSGDPLPVGP